LKTAAGRGRIGGMEMLKKALLTIWDVATRIIFHMLVIGTIGAALFLILEYLDSHH
jgi:hypothetical protein